MGKINKQDYQRLRALAEKQIEYAHSKQNDEILKKWRALAQGKRETPTVRLLFSNFTHEVITPRMQCEGSEARELEWALLSTLTGRELLMMILRFLLLLMFSGTWHCLLSEFSLRLLMPT